MKNNRKAQIVIAAVFLVVGILSVVTTWRLNTYIRATLPRDAAQEQCFQDAVNSINLWVQTQAQSYELHHERDVIINELLSDPAPATPEQIARLDAAIQKADASRLHYLQVVREHPLKTCQR
jgi:competence protein ComGC